MSYVQEGPLSHLSKEQLKTELILHYDIKEKIPSDYLDTVSFGERYIHWIVSPPDGHQEESDVVHSRPLEECLAEVKERKEEWDEMWQDRLKKLEKLSQGEIEEEQSSFEVSMFIYFIYLFILYLFMRNFQCSTFPGGDLRGSEIARKISWCKPK